MWRNLWTDLRSIGRSQRDRRRFWNWSYALLAASLIFFWFSGLRASSAILAMAATTTGFFSSLRTPQR